MRLSVALIVLVLAGCAVNNTRNQVLNDESLSLSTKNSIMFNQISTGMTKQQVIASWGEPCWICPGTREHSHGATWQYKSIFAPGIGQILYFDNSDTLTHWSGK